MIDVLAQEANLLLKNNNSYLIDVRTSQEWNSGIPYTNKITDTLLISWARQDAEQKNIFATEIMEMIPDKNSHLIFVCRSGYRSSLAANLMISFCYNNCYNVIDGIEGQNGWKNSGLPITIKNFLHDLLNKR